MRFGHYNSPPAQTTPPESQSELPPEPLGVKVVGGPDPVSADELGIQDIRSFEKTDTPVDTESARHIGDTALAGATADIGERARETVGVESQPEIPVFSIERNKGESTLDWARRNLSFVINGRKATEDVVVNGRVITEGLPAIPGALEDFRSGDKLVGSRARQALTLAANEARKELARQSFDSIAKQHPIMGKRLQRQQLHKNSSPNIDDRILILAEKVLAERGAAASGEIEGIISGAQQRDLVRLAFADTIGRYIHAKGYYEAEFDLIFESLLDQTNGAKSMPSDPGMALRIFFAQVRQNENSGDL